MTFAPTLNPSGGRRGGGSGPQSAPGVAMRARIASRAISTEAAISRSSSAVASNQVGAWRTGTSSAWPGATGNPSQRPRTRSPRWNMRSGGGSQKGQVEFDIGEGASGLRARPRSSRNFLYDDPASPHKPVTCRRMTSGRVDKPPAAARMATVEPAERIPREHARHRAARPSGFRYCPVLARIRGDLATRGDRLDGWVPGRVEPERPPPLAG